MRDPYAPVRGKCTWWREVPNETDRYDGRLKDGERRVGCSCFVEGKAWDFTAATVPDECPDSRYCRYYIKSA